MNVVARVYVLPGCQHCENAMNFWKASGLPAEFIMANADPIINAGIQKFGNQVPMLVSFATSEIITGFKEDDYKRIADRVRSFSAVPSSAPADGGGDSQSATPEAQSVEAGS